jgi:hypothetical protein
MSTVKTSEGMLYLNSLALPLPLMLCADKGRGKGRKTISLPLSDG